VGTDWVVFIVTDESAGGVSIIERHTCEQRPWRLLDLEYCMKPGRVEVSFGRSLDRNSLDD